MRVFLIKLLSLLSVANTVIDRTLVIVNDEAILESDVDKFLRKIRSKSYQELLGLDEGLLKNRETVINLLIEEKIIDQQVKKLDLKATEQEIDGQIKSILRRNNITLNQLNDRIRQLGTSMEDYRDGLRRQVERRNLVEREIKPNQEISEEQLRHFYSRTQRGDGEKEYRIAHIYIDIKKPGAADRAKKIYAEASSAPDDFEKYARDFSDDLTTSSTGGILGYFPLSQLGKEFREALKNQEVGKLTQPIKTSDGYHILKVLEVRTAGFATLPKEKREALRNQLMASELEKRMAMWIERKKADAHIRRTGGANPK